MIVVSTLAARVATAQVAGTYELGLDGGVVVTSNGRTITEVAFPIQNLRVGIFATERIAIEPNLNLIVFDKGGDTAHTLGAGLHFVYHTSPPSGTTSAFLKVGGAFNSVGRNRTVSRGGVSGGLGAKIRMSETWAFRTDADVAYFFETDSRKASWQPRLAFGVSIFSH
jgi:hypothetical protein